MIEAVLQGDLQTVGRLRIELSVAIARTKFAKAADAAMRMFVDFIDPRPQGTTAYFAAQGGHPMIIRLLHEMRADLDKPNTADGATPTHVAAQCGHTAMVQLLYDLGADVHRANNRGTRPIYSAAQQGHEKALLLIISLRADIDCPDMHMRRPLMAATIGGQVTTLRTLIAAKCDVNRTDDMGNSAVDCPREVCGDAVLQILRDSGCISRPFR